MSATCNVCKQEMNGVGCTLATYDDFVDGEARGRVRYGDETYRAMQLQHGVEGQPAAMRWLLPEGERDHDPTWAEVLAGLRRTAPENCPDCNAPKGGYHHPGCDDEECPRCGLQAIGCECVAVIPGVDA